MTRFTAQHIANIESAIEMWHTVPPENVAPGLRYFRNDAPAAPSCRTIACLGGWCAVWPPFVAQGVWADADEGIPRMEGLTVTHQVSIALFGDTDMFCMRGGHWADMLAGLGATDHAVVMHRLTSLLKRAKSELRVAA